MEKLGFILSKKVLVVLSGLIFGGVTFASSGAEALLQNNGTVLSETKIPEVQQIAETESSPSPSSTSAWQPQKKSNPVISAPQPVVAANTPVVTTAPKLPIINSITPPAPTPAPVAAKAVIPQISTAPKIGSSQNTIADSRQRDDLRSINEEDEDDEENEDDEDDEADGSELDTAFRRARDED